MTQLRDRLRAEHERSLQSTEEIAADVQAGENGTCELRSKLLMQSPETL